MNDLTLTNGFNAIQEKLENIASDLANAKYDSKLNTDALLREYFKYSRLLKLYYQAAIHDWEYFDWERADVYGWFCKNDYKIFPEISHLKPEEWKLRKDNYAGINTK